MVRVSYVARQYPGVVLAVFWMLQFLWFETLVFDFSIGSTMSQLPRTNTHHRILILGDPQLTDYHSYHIGEGPLLHAVEFYSDVFMRKAFQRLMRYHETFDVIIVMGDEFDGGLRADSQQWEHSFHRYKHIFYFAGKQQGENKPWPHNMFHLSGNHDLGYPSDESDRVAKRFQETFGPLDQCIHIGNKYDLLLMNAEFMDTVNTSTGRQQTEQFLEKNSNYSKYRILFTHIPLYRKDWQHCGEYRDSKPLSTWHEDHAVVSKQRTVNRQDYLLPTTSTTILQQVKPVLVFGGHDHDFCEHTHQTPMDNRERDNNRTVWQTADGTSFHSKEWTIGTFSWLQGNLFPSFSVVCLPRDNITHEVWDSTVHVGWLPTQLYNYLWYACSFGVTIVVAVGLWCCDTCKKKKVYTHSKDGRNRVGYCVACFGMVVVFYLLLISWEWWL